MRNKCKPWAAALLGLVLLPSVMAGSVGSFPFRSEVLPPVAHIPKSYRRFEQLFRQGLQTMPEGALLAAALSVGGRELGLSPAQSQRLIPHISAAYAAIADDPDFKGVSPALAYGFSTTPPRLGHYYMYRPDVLPAQPRCMVFLHGFGGNFQFYTWMLKQEFPDAVLLLPSWEMSWHEGSPGYLEDMLKDAGQRLGQPLTEVWLMGFSDGARGGFDIYHQRPDRYRGLISLAGLPETRQLRALRQDARILMLNGTEDQMIPVANARQQAVRLRQQVSDFKYHEMPGDHFFMLSGRAAAFRVIREFMEAKRP